MAPTTAATSTVPRSRTGSGSSPGWTRCAPGLTGVERGGGCGSSMTRGYALNTRAGEIIRVIDLAEVQPPPELSAAMGMGFWLVDAAGRVRCAHRAGRGAARRAGCPVAVRRPLYGLGQRRRRCCDAVSPESRRDLLDRFGLFGIRLSTMLIRQQTATPSALADELVRRSGLQQLQELLHTQFNERRDLLKDFDAPVAVVRGECSANTRGDRTVGQR